MAKKSALGRGLGALIKQSETEIPERQANATNTIDLRNIEVNPYQPRIHFDQAGLEELAASIRQLGIIQPITVREIADGKYQIITGERRYRASLIAGLTQIPAYIRHADDDNMLELALVENIQREDLNAMEIAISYQRLLDECQLTQENVSERVGKKRSTIANYLRLLKLPAEIQLAIRQGQLGIGHARALVNIEQTEHQLQLLHDIIENGLSARQVETAVRQINNPELPKESPEETDPSPLPPTRDEEETEEQPSDREVVIYEDHQLSVPAIGCENEQQLKEQLSRCFGVKVDLKRNAAGAGRVVIPFRTDAELQYILQMAEKIVEHSEALS